MKLYQTFNNILFESYIRDNETNWFWISPEDDIIKVPKLKHKDFIMKKYKDYVFGWDYDRVFNQAIKDGWVRGIYEYYPERFKGELSLNTFDKKRIIDILKYSLNDFIKFGNKTIYIDSENPPESRYFSTATIDGKRELNKFINDI